MRRKVLIVGIGAGNPDFVTVQAINVRGHVTLFFIPDHEAEEGTDRRMKDPARLRAEIVGLYVRNRPFRTTTYREPHKDGGEALAGDLRHAGLSFEELDASECGAFASGAGSR
ncbi:hypothetical protein ACFJIU_06745 [Mesorhizobium sp. UC74_2]|uniref:hypothetical protein n=1 Tax=Mesorhizobium sp. UC74_2 TaxID=3350171 RepID=UPI00366FB2D5